MRLIDTLAPEKIGRLARGLFYLVDTKAVDAIRLSFEFESLVRLLSLEVVAVVPPCVLHVLVQAIKQDAIQRGILHLIDRLALDAQHLLSFDVQGLARLLSLERLVVAPPNVLHVLVQAIKQDAIQRVLSTHALDLCGFGLPLVVLGNFQGSVRAPEALEALPIRLCVELLPILARGLRPQFLLLVIQPTRVVVAHEFSHLPQVGGALRDRLAD
jgi:hypothetical protein